MQMRHPRMVKRLKRCVVGSLLIGLIVACTGTGVTSEVTRFHRVQQPSGETIAIVPADEARVGSIEFASYAAIVADRLAALGYKVVTSGETDLVARMDYAVGPAETEIRAWPRNYVHYHFRLGHPYPYYFGHYWDEPEVYAYTVYPRSLDIDIVDKEGTAVFEGHVRSVGRESNMNQVIEYLVDAMFQNFPGESGVTKVVTISKDKDHRPY